MSQNKDHYDYDDANDFNDGELDSGFDLDFNDTKSMKKRHKNKARRNARHRLEDYFERKAMKAQNDEWDLDYDYDY